MKYFTTLLFLLPCLLWAQENNTQIISGLVVDEESQEPIPYANVFLKGSLSGTYTNELGEFELKVASLPADLSISHVGYQDLNVVLTAEQSFYRLALKLPMLESVSVVAKKSNKVYEIIEKAIARTQQQMRKNYYGKAFYRQVSQNDSTYNELYEIFYDARFNADGINDWALEQGRYALLENNAQERFIFNKNFTLLNRLIPTIQPDIKLFIMPIRPDVADFYQLKTQKILQADNKEIAVLEFRAKPKYQSGQTPIMEGELYIDLATYDILKISGAFVSDNFKLISFKGKGEAEDYRLNYECVFAPNEEGDLLMEYIKMDQQFTAVQPDLSKREVQTQSLLSFYEYYQPKKKNQRLGGRRLRFKKSDETRIDRLGYDPEFWRDNPIVKRTPIEEKVIASFEQRQQFGSIFLNNRNQVAFLPELDKDPFVKDYQKQLHENSPVQEKVYLQTDKPYYAQGEEIWINGFIVDASFHQLIDQSKVLYVDLIDPQGQLKSHQLFAIGEEGMAQGEIFISPNWPSGAYLLRAYTGRMQQFDPAFFFKRVVDIYTDSLITSTPTPTKDFDCSFFPEGGHLVENLTSRLAFKVIDQNGQGIMVKGELQDQNGKKLTNIKTEHDGMGSQMFRASPGQQYAVLLEYQGVEKRFSIPAALPTGYAMSVRTAKDKNITARVLCSPDLDESELYLIGQVRGQVYYKSKGSFKNRLLNFEIPKGLIPNGILQLSLMDGEGKAYCERLVFIDHGRLARATAETNARSEGERKEIAIDIELKTQSGRLIKDAHVAVAVTDQDQIVHDPYAQNLRNYLLLTSDLRGNFRDPGQYLDPENPQASKQLDLLMLTHGWRKFDWQDQASQQLLQATSFEQGFSLCGTIKSEDFTKYQPKILNLVTVPPSPTFATTEVDENGQFCFSNLNYADSSQIFLVTYNNKGKTIDMEVDFATSPLPDINYQALPKVKVQAPEKLTTYLNNNKEQLLEAYYASGQHIMLDEVEVVEKRKKRPEARNLYLEPDAVVMVDEEAPSLFQALQGQIPSLRVYYDGFYTHLRLRGGDGDPLVLIDGVPINQPTIRTSPTPQADNSAFGGGGQGSSGQRRGGSSLGQTVNESLFHILEGINPSTIDRVEVLVGPSAAIYGIRGGNGVLAIFTKNIEGAPGKTLPSQHSNGLYTARTFYVPSFESQEGPMKDRRSTLYWSPGLRSDQNGKIQLRFPNSTIGQRFMLQVEGITKGGLPISEQIEFELNTED